MANKLILESKPDYKKPTLRQSFLKILFLHFMPKFPKNVKGPKFIDAKNDSISNEQFEEERNKFVEYIKAFTKRTDPIEVTHPFFGRLNTKQWGVVSWMHMDHHLRQFGV